MARISRTSFIALAAGAALLSVATAVSGALALTNTPRGAPAGRVVGAPAPAVIAQASGDASQVTIQAREFAYDAPDTVAAGVDTFTLQNAGTVYHMAQFLKLNDGVTADQVLAATRAGTAADALALGTLAGGANAIEPGDSQVVTFDMTPGNYVMLCFVYTDDNVPHVVKGMLHPFAVTPPASAATAPAADLSVTAQDFEFNLPAVASGQQTVQFSNQGTQPHEMALIKLSSGQSPEAAQQALLDGADAAPLQTEYAGGVTAITPGSSGWATVNFTPGLWMFVCYVPEASSGVPHATLGMSRIITVTDSQPPQ